MEPRLFRPYFGRHRVEHPEGAVSYALGYGAWVRLLRESGFEIEDLLEPTRPEGASSTYWDEREYEWATRWPSDAIWKERNRG